MATIKDIANRAGVSFKTVSRVLNGSMEVAQPTRERVLRAAQDLAYRPNASARRLVTGRTNTIGVVIPASADYVFTHLYFNEILRGIGETLKTNGYDLLLHLGEPSMPYAELVRQQKVDGLILLSIAIDDPNHEELMSSDIPCVFTSRVKVQNNPTNWVDANASPGITQAVDHLAELGHTRIGMLTGPPNMVLAREQLSSFRKAMEKWRIPTVERWIRQSAHTVESGEERAMDILAATPRPTALICADDMAAIGAIRSARRLGIHVPGGLSVVGFDDVILARYSVPALTTVRQPTYQKGELAASQILELLSGNGSHEPWQRLLDTELIIRDSTDHPPTELTPDREGLV